MSILERLHGPAERRLALRVSRDAERQIRAGHPWLFDRSIIHQSADGNAGDLAVVFDTDRRFVAIGLYDPGSPIRVRILHTGRPATIDGRWLANRLARAVDRRRSLFTADRNGRSRPAPTTAFRLVHGENDGLPGLVIDWYAGAVVVKAYSAAWLPWLAQTVAALPSSVAPIADSSIDSAHPIRYRVVLRLARAVRAVAPDGVDDGSVVAGPPLSGPVPFLENGLPFTADLARGHKTGHFLDQRDNRQLVADLVTTDSAAEGKGRYRLLDVFACTGGFAAHGAAAGARSVTMVDASRPALDLARRHVLAAVEAGGNGHRADVHVQPGDAFDVMDRLARAGRRYDIVVVDPPSFAHRAGQIERARAAYRRSAGLACRLVAPGGVLFHASCSSRVDEATFLRQIEIGLSDAGRSGERLAVTGHAVDHPIGFAHGAYLKAIALRFDR